MRNISCLRKVLKPQNVLQFFMTSLTSFFCFPPFYCRLDKTGNEVFYEQCKIYWLNSLGWVVSLYNILTMGKMKLLPRKFWWYSSKIKTESQKNYIFVQTILVNFSKIVKPPCVLEIGFCLLIFQWTQKKLLDGGYYPLTIKNWH